MKAAELLPGAVRRLDAAGVADPGRDARRLLAHALNVDPGRLLLHIQDDVSQEVVARFDAAVTARATRQPVAQIVGSRSFWGRDFRVTRDVLDPRPETEALIGAALQEPFVRVLDLGTGTGAILLTLLAESPRATGVGVDLSPAALSVAQENARALALADRVVITRSDWFAGVDGRFDLIVSNPPYISAVEMAALDPEVRDWEPHMALTPGGDGLDAYRAIAAGAAAHLTKTGRVLVEIGPTQAASVGQLFHAGGFQSVQIIPDMDGRDRVVVARLR